MSRPPAPSLRRHLDPGLKVWLNYDGLFLMGPRYLRFLTAVKRTGTIRAAGREVGWSYRTCLNRLRRMERVLGSAVLLTTRGGRRGGGARLSPAAARLVRVFGQWQREVGRLTRKAFRDSMSR
jgi:molybdate transport system regulatory protein